MQYEHSYPSLNYYVAFHVPVIQVECSLRFYTLHSDYSYSISLEEMLESLIDMVYHSLLDF